jgi:hypothetical protein
LICDDVTRRLTAFVDGELDDATQSAVRGHLRTCEACRHAAADELAVRDAMAKLPAPEVPTELWRNVSAQLAKAEVADSERSRWWLWWQGARPKVWPAALVAAAATLAIVAYVRRDRAETGPAVATEAAPPPSALAAPSIADPPTSPTVEDDCDLHGIAARTDAAHRAAAMTAAVDRCYSAAADELLAVVELDRPGWSTERAKTFDAELDTARHAVTTAAAGRPRERAWQAVIQLLQRAVTVPVIAQVTP